MDILTTSLDALLQRATNPQNQNTDIAAVEAFCVLINKEKEGCNIGVKLLAARLHSRQEKEVLQSLNILDMCMQKCGSSFQSEVGKFRFLNEMIKLVSPKYLGSQTPLSVRQKVLQLMYLWTLDYPTESKIKEAYDMLKKQGVIKEVPLSVNAENCAIPERKANSIFNDEEKSNLLQKLLQSKNPEDLQAANRLIKCMVKEEDKRAELKSRRVIELESVHNSVRLLHEMLDSYKQDSSSHNDLELIKELYQNCERLRPSILKLANNSPQSEENLNEILLASDELGKVFEKYKEVIIRGSENSQKIESESNLSLLDFDGNSESALLDEQKCDTSKENVKQSEFDILCDIFTTPNVTNSSSVSENDILKPIPTLLKDVNPAENGENVNTNGKAKALDDLDALGEHLLKQNLQSSIRQGFQFQKNPDKIPMNLLPTLKDTKLLSKSIDNKNPVGLHDALNFDLTYLLEKPIKEDVKNIKCDQNGDDLLVDIAEDVPANLIYKDEKADILKESTDLKINEIGKIKTETKLSDVYVELESIKPSSIQPLMVHEEKNGINVTLHFAKDRPREDVSVIVVTIVSKSEHALKNVLFRAIVPKTCKVKLQPASATDLPPFNPFLPPAAITQIMLIANPENVLVSLKFIISYNIDDETTTEMGEIDSLPILP